MLVSIVVNNYNYGRFLAEAVDSALVQTHPEVEVIAVDDGSTDNSREILESYGDRISAYFKPNGGQASACEYGIAQCRGEIVFFLDSDDVMYPTMVETVVEAWQPACSKVQFQLDTIDAGGRNLDMVFPYFPEGMTPAEIRRQSLTLGVYHWPVTLGNAYSRRFLEQVMPFPDFLTYSADTYLNKVAPLFGDVVTVRNVLGAYRVHGSNNWAQKNGSVERYQRALETDLKLRRVFVDMAARQGYEVDIDMMALNRSNLETRMLSRRLAPAKHPIPGDRISTILFQGFRSARISPGLTLAGRLLWAGWYFALAVLPAPVVKFLISQARMQDYRLPLFAAMIRLTRKNRLRTPMAG